MEALSASFGTATAARPTAVAWGASSATLTALRTALTVPLALPVPWLPMAAGARIAEPSLAA